LSQETPIFSPELFFIFFSFWFVFERAFHKNGDSKNNHVDNLYYGTAQDNANDRILHGNSLAGEKNANAKFTDNQVKEIKKRIHNGTANKVLAHKYGVTTSTISAIRNGKTWKHIEVCGE